MQKRPMRSVASYTTSDVNTNTSRSANSDQEEVHGEQKLENTK